MKYGMMICGTIGAGYDWWSGTYGTRSKDVKAYLDAHPDEEVDIAVSSPGGYVDEGLTIYQLIKDHGHVNVHIMGMTASIATQGRRIKLRCPPKVLTGTLHPSLPSIFSG